MQKKHQLFVVKQKYQSRNSLRPFYSVCKLSVFCVDASEQTPAEAYIDVLILRQIVS